MFAILLSIPAFVYAQDVNVSVVLGTDVTSQSLQYSLGAGIKGSVLFLDHIHVAAAVVKHLGETKTINYGSASQVGVSGGGQSYKSNPTLLAFDVGYQFNLPITKSFKFQITPTASAGYMLIKVKSSGVYGEETININRFGTGSWNCSRCTDYQKN